MQLVLTVISIICLIFAVIAAVYTHYENKKFRKEHNLDD
ncbi:hypothetical protein CIP107532_00129 [Corynebacterium diphtheriae]|nr:hypothetical protein CIP107524_00146 [Corynebacterium diphtheriae]CAB0541391.1 hypothetical protein CIP107532_00129 [Corynebacterium diphtheriae]